MQDPTMVQLNRLEEGESITIQRTLHPKVMSISYQKPGEVAFRRLISPANETLARELEELLTSAKVYQEKINGN